MLHKMSNGLDFVERLGADASICVLSLLGDPADLARVSSVSRSWRRFIIANGFFKNLCLRICPEVSKFTQVMEVKNCSHETSEVGSSSGVEWETLEREHRVFSYLSHCLVSQRGQRDCILESVCASSTDNYPDESIANTLEPHNQVFASPSYWSSQGESDREVPETLTYILCSKLCVINEIQIRPFEAFFQPGNPIYSAKAVRFRMGHYRMTQETRIVTRKTRKDTEHAMSPRIGDDNYFWTYVSPVFPMVQKNILQSFKLPRPIICIGGVIQIELLGRIQKQEMDNLYYICVCHVRVIGLPLSPALDVDILESSGNSVLEYFPDAPCSGSPVGPPKDEARDSARVGWIRSVLRGSRQWFR